MQAVGHKYQTVSVYPAKVSFVIAFKNRYVKNALVHVLVQDMKTGWLIILKHTARHMLLTITEGGE